jgi:hypothetical protein
MADVTYTTSISLRSSIAMVQINIFLRNEIIKPSKFVKIIGIFDQIYDSENQGVI